MYHRWKWSKKSVRIFLTFWTQTTHCEDSYDFLRHRHKNSEFECKAGYSLVNIHPQMTPRILKYSFWIRENTLLMYGPILLDWLRFDAFFTFKIIVHHKRYYLGILYFTFDSVYFESHSFWYLNLVSQVKGSSVVSRLWPEQCSVSWSSVKQIIFWYKI